MVEGIEIIEIERIEMSEDKKEKLKKQVITVLGIIFQNGKVLFIKQNDRGWALPGGKVDFGESLEAAVKREVKEEIDLIVEPTQLIFTTTNMHENESRIQHAVNLFYLCKLISGKETAHPPVIDLKWFTPNEIKYLDSVFKDEFKKLSQVLEAELKKQQIKPEWFAAPLFSIDS